jgi:2-keto-4-pentenoate hydratase
MIETLADQVMQSLAKRERFQPVRGADGAPIDLPTAYAIQAKVVADRHAKGWGDIAGYKCGLTTATMQAFCGVSESIAGRLFSTKVLTSPAIIKAADYVRLGLESETAVRLGRDVPAWGDDADPLRLIDYVETVHSAFEVIDDRDADYKTLDAPSIVAEDSWNQGLVVGAGVDPRKLADLHDLTAVLTMDGQEAGRGNSNAALGGPLNVLAWLSRFLAREGVTLKAGQWVTTGSIVPTVFAKPGQVASFEIEGLPPVRADVV